MRAPLAYYNEIDPFAAQWLRNLIAAGHLPAGEVDERSIVDVQPEDLEGFTQCHFSRASAVGRMRFSSLGGPMSGKSGPDHVPVSRFRALDSARAMPTNDTSGPLFTASSKSAGLQLSLENRLRALMAASGSPEYVLTWKTQDMPAGVPICALRASGLRISGSDCSGWPTPTKGNADGSQMAKGASATGRRPDGSKATVSLNHVATLAGWPTPMAGTKATDTYNEAGNTDSGRKTQSLFPARTDAPAALRLNHHFSRWLQGFPSNWSDFAPSKWLDGRKS